MRSRQLVDTYKIMYEVNAFAMTNDVILSEKILIGSFVCSRATFIDINKGWLEFCICYISIHFALLPTLVQCLTKASVLLPWSTTHHSQFWIMDMYLINCYCLSSSLFPILRQNERLICHMKHFTIVVFHQDTAIYYISDIYYLTLWVQCMRTGPRFKLFRSRSKSNCWLGKLAIPWKRDSHDAPDAGQK